ncbi:MAG: hypothetical protein ABIN36_16765 [Ferruginibacter sp.]
MKYELQQLEQIVTVDLNPKNFYEQKNKNAFIKKCVESIFAEVGRIGSALIFEIINCGIEKQIVCYVHGHQHGMTNLLDTLHSYLLKENAASIYKYPELKVYLHDYNNILVKLEAILKLIQADFKLYYDKEYKVPDCLRCSFSFEIKKILADASTTLRKNEIDDRLINLLKSPFEYCIGLANFMNQRDLDYLQVFKNEVRKLLTQESINAFDIYALLIKVNFNDPAFTFYYIEKLKNAETKESATARILEYYYLQLKNVNQVVKIPGLAYDPSLSSVADQIGTWLAEEIYFLEKKKELEYISQENKTADRAGKIKTTLTVSHLSIAIKLLMETGVIMNTNASDIIRMVSKTFKTGRSENISEDSLRNKAYNIESSAIEGVKNVIVGLLNEVRKY